MFDDRVLHPIGVGRAGSAIRFEVVDTDLAAGELWSVNDQPMRRWIGQRERGFVCGVSGDSDQTNHERGELSEHRSLRNRLRSFDEELLAWKAFDERTILGGGNFNLLATLAWFLRKLDTLGRLLPMGIEA